MSSGLNGIQDDVSRQQIRAENRQTYIMFGVATIFIVGHSLRIALDIQEVYWLVNGRGATEDPDTTAECERPSRSVTKFLNLFSLQFEVLASIDYFVQSNLLNLLSL